MNIYGDLNSGNCLKVKYLCDHLGIAYAWIPIDMGAGDTKTAAFLTMNPQGQVPVIELEDGRSLAQSNAILGYLAAGSALLPVDGFARAKVEEWLYWEQYSHEPYVAVCRYQMVYLKKPKSERESWRVERGERALDYMEGHFERMDHGEKFTPSIRPYLAGGTMTIADVSLLTYTRLAHEGGFDMGTRPHVRNWVARCEHKLNLNPAQA